MKEVWLWCGGRALRGKNQTALPSPRLPDWPLLQTSVGQRPPGKEARRSRSGTATLLIWGYCPKLPRVLDLVDPLGLSPAQRTVLVSDTLWPSDGRCGLSAFQEVVGGREGALRLGS